jgi:protein TonB
MPAPQLPAARSTARLAPRDPTLDEWKQRAAERIHEVSRAQLFEGRPEHLLRAVIVVEATVDRQGKVMRSRVMRSPGIATLDGIALRSLQNASPLPAPPAALTAKGPLVYHETWLFRKDGRFQLRTLALPQE